MTISDQLDRLADLSHAAANAMHDRGDSESRKRADQLYRVAKVVSEWAEEIKRKDTQ